MQKELLDFVFSISSYFIQSVKMACTELDICYLDKVELRAKLNSENAAHNFVFTQKFVVPTSNIDDLLQECVVFFTC
jgi:hypothetical protein